MFISVLFFWWMFSFPPFLPLLCLALLVRVCLARICDFFKTVSGDLNPKLLFICCNCPFGAVSPARSPSRSLPLAAILFDLSLFLPLHLFFPCTTHYWTPDMFNRHVLCIIAVAQMVCFSINCNAAFPILFCQEMETIVFWHFFFFVFKSLPHLCAGWQRIFAPHNSGPSSSHLLWMGLVFSMSAPLPFTQHPQHADSQARGLTLTNNGCVQLQGISNKVLS